MSVVVFFASVTVVAQGTSPSSRAKSVPVFKANGLDRVARGNKPPPPPPPRGLNSADFTDISKLLGKVESGSPYVTLTPSHPAVANKGVLLFWDSQLVETGENYAFWGEKEMKKGAQGSVNLWLWSPASRQYMIDCSLSGYQYGTIGVAQFGRKGASFNVIGPGGEAQLFDFSETVVSGPETYTAFDLLKIDNAGVHLVFVLNADTKGWYGFQIVPKGMIPYIAGGSGPNLAQWAFFSCDVKNLVTRYVPGS